jgi:hypothetical protein
MKHIVTKVGFVYKTKKTSAGVRYLQLVAIDRANLSSDVIVVFKPKDIKSDDLEEITSRPIEFYTHTTVSAGVRLGMWEKVGKAEVKIDPKALSFGYYRDQWHINLMKKVAKSNGSERLYPPFEKPYWDIWDLTEEKYSSFGWKDGLRAEMQYGGIAPPTIVIKTIEGKYTPLKNIWPK